MANITEIIQLVALQLGKHRVAPEDRFIEDLGAESIDIVNIIATAEERYGLFISEEAMGRIRTPGDLLAHIQGADRGNR